MGFIVIGAFALTGESVSGAVLADGQPRHLHRGAVLLDRDDLRSAAAPSHSTGSRGLQRQAPVLAGVFTSSMLASIGVPGLNGFVGEFLILAGTFLTHRWWAVVADDRRHRRRGLLALGGTSRSSTAPSRRGRAAFAEMTVARGAGDRRRSSSLIVFLGVYPKPVLDRITPSVDQLSPTSSGSRTR